MAPKSLGWVDIHAHFSPRKNYEDQRKRVATARAENFLMPEDWQYDTKQTLAYLDRAGIGMQMLSTLPYAHEALRESNDLGYSIVKRHPNRFGLLAGMPTDSVSACLEEIKRTDGFDIKPDGYAVLTAYNHTTLDDEALSLFYEELNRRKAVLHIHPDALGESLHNAVSAACGSSIRYLPRCNGYALCWSL